MLRFLFTFLEVNMTEKKTNAQAFRELEGKLDPGLMMLENLLGYVNATTKINLICKIHGPIKILFNKAKIGQGCGLCKAAKLSNKFRMSQKEAMRRNTEAQGNTYGYSKFVYVNNHTKAIYICPQHGDFLKTPIKFWEGQGCPICQKENYIAWNRRGNFDVIALANEVHYNRYEYNDPRGYENCKEPRWVTCKTHGDFLVTMDNHINNRSGCPKCSHKISLAETDISNYLKDLGLTVVNTYKLLNRKHIDIFLPDLNIGIEYNGLYYHGERMKPNTQYHKEKMNVAHQQGISLIQIFEDEYLHKKDIVLKSLKNKTGKNPLVYDGRNLDVGLIPRQMSDKFLEDHHLQGAPGNEVLSMALHISSSPEIVAVMTFSSRPNTNEVELSRFATVGRIRGGFSKLLKSSILMLKGKYNTIVSFSDNRWGEGNVYRINGFSKVKDLDPDYYWCRGQRRFHKRKFQRQYLPDILETFDPNLSEAENCRNNGYYKIWDAGKIKWELLIE